MDYKISKMEVYPNGFEKVEDRYEPIKIEHGQAHNYVCSSRKDAYVGVLFIIGVSNSSMTFNSVDEFSDSVYNKNGFNSVWDAYGTRYFDITRDEFYNLVIKTLGIMGVI